MPVIVYCTVGSNDIERAKEFYDSLLSSAGIDALGDHPSGGRIYGAGGVASFAVVRPFDGKPASAGNGSMFTFSFERPAEVDRFHAAALKLGGTDEGPPGERAPGIYMAYVRDLDGNKLAALCRA